MDVQPLGKLARTHTCGELTAAHAGTDVVLLGWVHRVRDLGGVMFFDLRDRHGTAEPGGPGPSPPAGAFFTAATYVADCLLGSTVGLRVSSACRRVRQYLAASTPAGVISSWRQGSGLSGLRVNPSGR